MLSCVQHFVTPMDYSPPGSSVHRILQARTLEWVAVSFSSACMHAKSLQLCPTLCDAMDSSSPGSSVHRILQTRVLEWAAVSFSTQNSCPFPLHRGLVTTEDEMVGWHHRLNGHEFEHTLEGSEEQESLVCCSPWSPKSHDMTE